ncbi:MAG TPA: ABC transporter permease [Propionibacteriaceae bacterium]|jgi:ABC-2 type transport system permease protein|nr:ABC transporter permease [Propionibacteriaceae bacterium]
MSTVLTASSVFVGRSLRHSLRDAEVLLMGISLPVLLMLLFTYVFGGAISGGQTAYVSYVTPGIILLCAGFGASSSAVYVSRDLATGTIDRFRTMPVPAATVLVGHVVSSLLRNLVATGVVVLVAILVGFRPQAGLGGWLGALALIALWILAVTALFVFLGLVAGSPEAASAYGFVFLFLPYVSSAFVPVDTLPSWLRGFAEHQPITPVIESIRALLLGGSPGAQAWWAVAWSLLILLVPAVAIAVLFPRLRSR